MQTINDIFFFAKLLLPGFARSGLIFILTLVLSVPLGFLVTFGRMSRFAPLRWFVSAYISIMRGTPLMLQLMVAYYGPFWLFGIRLSDLPNWKFFATMLGFILNYAAYFAEIFRGGINSISIGQHEAGAVLGFTKMQTFFHVILPQVIRTILPSVTNEVVTLVKDTSLAHILGYVEMFTTATRNANTYSTIIPFFVAGIFYYIANAVVQSGMGRLEKRMDYYKR